MGWLNFGGKKRDRAQGFGDSSKTKSRKRPKSFILEKIVTPSAGFGDWEHEFDHLHQLLGSWSLSDLHLPNFFADSGVCPIAPGAPTNNLPPLIDFDPLGLYHDGIATQTPYNPGGAFETLPIALIPVDPHSPNPNNPNAIRQLLNFPLASQPLVGSIDTGVSADSPYLNYANIKKGRDYVGGDDNPLLKAGEGSEHGTFMLGIVDAINKTAPKWVGRAIDSGRWADSLVEFVDAAKASGQKNAIANLSLDLTQKNADGSVTTRYELTPAERSAIEYARQNGVMLVVAAGNDGGVMSVLGQASQEFDNIFTVGAGDINGRSNYSSYGRGLDIVADGGTTEHPNLSTVGNDLGTMAGTSVATAKVAGAASLVWAANPALNYRQVMEILKSTARDLGPVGWDDETGFGFLNTLAAVDLAQKTRPEVYQPIAFLKPTTWGGEGLVTPTERAVNIINENFSAWVVSSNGITLRNSPNTSDRSNFAVKYGDTLTFDGWTYGEQLNDLTTKEPDALWYRFRYNGGTYWVPSAWTGGYPGSKPPLLPPTQQPPQQPPQQPTANTVYLSTSSGQILQVNTATGAQNPIYQGRAFTDLAVAPNGKLYGCTFFDGLYEINPSTGAERYVGSLAGGTLNSLTFSPDGRLYGADQGNGNLFQISPDNGQMNLIGNLGGPSSGDLLFNGTNEIFATVSSPNTSLNDRLVAVNLATGNSRYIGDLGFLEVYGLSWENGQLTAYTSDRRKLAIDPNTAKATVVGTVSSNGLIWGAATKPATGSSPTDDVRQKFLYAASQYPQVGAAITGMQDQGGGVFRQEFERAIMIWNGQQVTVYETKGRSVSPTSPSPNPQPVNNLNQSLIAALRAAIFGQESGYNYKAVNPNSGALGIAQVMPANIPSWSREALGYQITDNQFLNSPDLQLKIIDYKLNQYYQQAIAASGGNLDIAVRRVASAWYSGNPNKYNSTTPEYTNGVQYPSIANYTLSVLAKFQQAYGGGSSNKSNNSNNSGGNIGPIGYVESGVTPIDDPALNNAIAAIKQTENANQGKGYFQIANILRGMTVPVYNEGKWGILWALVTGVDPTENYNDALGQKEVDLGGTKVDIAHFIAVLSDQFVDGGGKFTADFTSWGGDVGNPILEWREGATNPNTNQPYKSLEEALIKGAGGEDAVDLNANIAAYYIARQLEKGDKNASIANEIEKYDTNNLFQEGVRLFLKDRLGAILSGNGEITNKLHVLEEIASGIRNYLLFKGLQDPNKGRVDGPDIPWWNLPAQMQRDNEQKQAGRQELFAATNFFFEYLQSKAIA